MNDKLIKVLWVEDDPKVTAAFPIEAARYGLHLIPYSNWEDAREALVENYSKWSAIILDAKCKKTRDSHDNAVQFLGQALSDIGKISEKHHRMMPWFVLSGGSEDEVNDSIIDDRLEWDSDRPKKYYSKATERELLFHRIPYKASVSAEFDIRKLRYPDVFKAIDELHLDPEFEIHMLDLLMPIHSYKINDDDFNYNHRMTLIRKCIEMLFHSMSEYGILPNQKNGNGYRIHDILSERRGGINITWCSKILSGLNIMKDESKMLIESRKSILPNVLKDSFQRLIEIASAYEHAENPNATEEQLKNSRHTGEFLKAIGDAPYLLVGMTMELCCIIKWYANYLDQHDDEELNALEWEVK